MTNDQKERLAELSDALLDIFITEASPNEWAGAEVQRHERDSKTKSDRHYDIKIANQLGLLAMRTLDLKGRLDLAMKTEALALMTNIENPDAEIERYEREAKKLLERYGVT